MKICILVIICGLIMVDFGTIDSGIFGYDFNLLNIKDGYAALVVCVGALMIILGFTNMPQPSG
jgi:hypothetical protein